MCDAWDLIRPAMFRELERRSYIYRLTRPNVLYPSHPERHTTYILRA